MTAACQCAPCRRCDYLECTCATEDPPDRKPAAGWVEYAGNFYLAAGEVCARVTSSGVWAMHRGRWTVNAWQSGRIVRASKWTKAPTIVAAQLAAEGALRSIAAEILRAVKQ